MGKVCWYKQTYQLALRPPQFCSEYSQ